MEQPVELVKVSRRSGAGGPEGPGAERAGTEWQLAAVCARWEVCFCLSFEARAPESRDEEVW